MQLAEMGGGAESGDLRKDRELLRLDSRRERWDLEQVGRKGRVSMKTTEKKKGVLCVIWRGEQRICRISSR